KVKYAYMNRGVCEVALGDAILACLTERPMTGYELAKTFDASIGFFWKADHQQIYRELSRLRDRGHIQGREVVQSGKPNKLVYTLTPEGRAALRHWAARPSEAASIKDDLLVRLYALDSVDVEPLRTDLMARLEHHCDRFARYERLLNKRFPQGTARPAVPFLNPFFTVTRKSRFRGRRAARKFYCLFSGTRGEADGTGGAPERNRTRA